MEGGLGLVTASSPPPEGSLSPDSAEGEPEVRAELQHEGADGRCELVEWLRYKLGQLEADLPGMDSDSRAAQLGPGPDLPAEDPQVVEQEAGWSTVRTAGAAGGLARHCGSPDHRLTGTLPVLPAVASSDGSIGGSTKGSDSLAQPGAMTPPAAPAISDEVQTLQQSVHQLHVELCRRSQAAGRCAPASLPH